MTNPNSKISDSHFGSRKNGPGFRCSRLDLPVIVISILVAFLAYSWIGQWALVLPVVLGHFFLFCNVFRIGNRLEYVWAGIFLVNVSVWTFLDDLDWLRIMIWQSPVTLLILFIAVRRSNYHGVGYTLLHKK